MPKKPTYEDLEKRVQELEKEPRERKRIEEALRESEVRFRKVYDTAPFALVVWDINACVVDWNKKAEALFGWAKDEVVGNNFFDFLIPDKYRQHAEDVVNNLLKGDLQSHSVSDNLTKDRKTITCEWNNSLLHDNDGNIIGVISLGLDITERRLIEEEKAQLQIQLHQAQKMEAVGTLAGGIAHDFNNLLMGILGNVSLCLLDIDSSHPFFEKLENIEKYIQNGIDLTKQLLGFARGGKYEVRPTDLNEIIKNQNRMLGRTRKDITIRGKYEKDLWSVEVDRGQIDQVILNLYLNAYQAMPKGGNLNIRTENITFDKNDTKPYHFEPGKYVKISVADSGVGMNEITQKRIFEPFFTTREVDRGTGMGLASVYGIVKNHGGYIDVYSKEGEGSTFNIYLPACGKKVVYKNELSKDLLKGSETILLVDDEGMIIDVGRQILETLGYTTLTASNGMDAIQIYSKNQDKIDLVILDMIMPEMDGGKVYDKIKKINPNFKALLSSGYTIDGQATEILQRGCNGFIQKPFNIVDLSKKIRDVLDKDYTVSPQKI